MNALSPQNEILHITHNHHIASEISKFMRITTQKCDVASFPLELSHCALPKSLNIDEIERCIKQGYRNSSSVDEDIRKFAKIQFDKYKKIIIWYTKESSSVLLMYFICHILPYNNLYYVFCDWDWYLYYPYQYDNMNTSYKHCKKLTSHQYTKFKNIYSNLLETEGIPKIAKGQQIILTDKERWKKHILRYVKKQPVYIDRLIEASRREQSITEYEFYLALILELIEEKRIIPVENTISEEARESAPYPIAKWKKLNNLPEVRDFFEIEKNSHFYTKIYLCKYYPNCKTGNELTLE